MNANPKFIASSAHVDEAAVQPLPRSRKIHVEGSRPDIRVPMREISQSDTPASFGAEPNPPVTVYDTSGPYTDLSVRIDIRKGLAPLREKWIEERDDTERLAGPTSRYGQERLADPKLAELRFDLKRLPRRAKAGRVVTQMHYARRGIVTPEMEFVAIRENLRRDEYLASLAATGPTGARMAELLGRQHPGQSFGTAIPARMTPEFVRAVEKAEVAAADVPLARAWLLGTLPVEVLGPPLALSTMGREQESLVARKRAWALGLKWFLLGGGGLFLALTLVLGVVSHRRAAGRLTREILGDGATDDIAHEIAQAQRAVLLRAVALVVTMALGLVLTVVVLASCSGRREVGEVPLGRVGADICCSGITASRASTART